MELNVHNAIISLPCNYLLVTPNHDIDARHVQPRALYNACACMNSAHYLYHVLNCSLDVPMPWLSTTDSAFVHVSQ